MSDLGIVTGSFRYRAYGELARSSGTGPAYLGYAGQLADPSGLLYLRARWYDPAAGRFLTRDPVMGDLMAPVSLNPFLYANANPVVLTDPSGRCAPSAWLMALCNVAQRVGTLLQRFIPWLRSAEPAAERLASSEAQLIARLGKVEQAAALGGSRVVQAASRTEADEVAARWVGENAAPLLERGTDRVVGMVNWATGRVARSAEYDRQSGWHFDLEQLAPDEFGWWSGSAANVHLLFPGP